MAREESIGTGAVTDGEFRRGWWHLDFFDVFDGIDLAARPRPANFKGEGESPPIPVITGPVRHSHPIFVDAFSYLASVAHTRLPKLTIPGPGVATLMGGRTVVDETTYPDMESFWADLVAGYRDTTNAIIADHPDDLLITTHMCHGNFRSRWVASGGYEPIAELVFGGMHVDAFMEDFKALMREPHILPVPWVESIDVSNAVLYLACDESRYVTGVALPTDAGLLTK